MRARDSHTAKPAPTKQPVALAVMQPYLLPYVGYFQLVRSVDKFVLYDDVSYIKQGWINRNTILCSGNELRFTLPLSNGRSGVPINEISLASNFPAWKKRFLKSVAAAYQKSPNYLQVFHMLDSWLTDHDGMLAEILRRSIADICEWIGLTTQVIPTSTKYNNTCLGREERLIDICKQEGASVYVNPEGGRTLYQKESFAAEGIELNFLEAQLGAYPQCRDSFMPGMSILDFIMNVKRDESLAYLGFGRLS